MCTQLDAAVAARNSHCVANPVNASETLEGTLDQVLFVNENNGYSVAVVVVAGEHGDFRRVTVVGNLAGLEVGSTIRAQGGFETHARFGDQFHVVDFETVRPAGAVALERYLASEIKGIGPILAHRIASSGRATGCGAENTSASVP